MLKTASFMPIEYNYGICSGQWNSISFVWNSVVKRKNVKMKFIEI